MGQDGRDHPHGGEHHLTAEQRLHGNRDTDRAESRSREDHAAETAAAGPLLQLTRTAAAKVAGFLTEHPEPQQVALRIAVQAGGCAGFRYALFLDDRTLDGDILLQQHGIAIRIDPASAPYLAGSSIDWKESLAASGFSIDNPNSHGSCACGDSTTF